MDAYDVKVTSQDLKPKQEIVQLQDNSSFEEMIAQSMETFRLAVGDEYYDSYIERASHMDVETAKNFGARMGKCGGKLGLAMEQSSPVDSKEVQELVAKHWEIIKMVYPNTSSKHIYLAIRDQMCYSPMTASVPEAKAFCDYLAAAMDVFAQSHFAQD